MRPTSDESKRAAGTFTPARARTPMNVPNAIPQPPKWLSVSGLIEWHALVPTLAMSGLLTNADTTGLAALCELNAELAESPREFSTGKHKERRMLAAEFGCSVSARLKLKAPEGASPPEPDKCQPQKDGKVVSFSDRLSATRKALSQAQLTPADTSSSPAKDS